MKSDINPDCHTWKLRTLRNIVHGGAWVHVNRVVCNDPACCWQGELFQPSQRDKWVCLLNPVVLFKSSAKPWMAAQGHTRLCLAPHRQKSDTMFACCSAAGGLQTVSGWRCSAPFVRPWPFPSAVLPSFCSAVTLKDVGNGLKISWTKKPVSKLNKDVEL